MTKLQRIVWFSLCSAALLGFAPTGCVTSPSTAALPSRRLSEMHSSIPSLRVLRDISARAEATGHLVELSIGQRGTAALVTFDTHEVAIEPTRILADGKQIAQIALTARVFQLHLVEDKLTIRVDGQPAVRDYSLTTAKQP